MNRNLESACRETTNPRLKAKTTYQNNFESSGSQVSNFDSVGSKPTPISNFEGWCKQKMKFKTHRVVHEKNLRSDSRSSRRRRRFEREKTILPPKRDFRKSGGVVGKCRKPTATAERGPLRGALRVGYRDASKIKFDKEGSVLRRPRYKTRTSVAGVVSSNALGQLDL